MLGVWKCGEGIDIQLPAWELKIMVRNDKWKGIRWLLERGLCFTYIVRTDSRCCSGKQGNGECSKETLRTANSYPPPGQVDGEKKMSRHGSATEVHSLGAQIRASWHGKSSSLIWERSVSVRSGSGITEDNVSVYLDPWPCSPPALHQTNLLRFMPAAELTVYSVEGLKSWIWQILLNSSVWLLWLFCVWVDFMGELQEVTCWEAL